MLIGYARVSTNFQNLDLQKDALKEAGCEKIIVDEASGAKSERPGLKMVLEILREGDTLVIWRLDRLGRSIFHLIELVNNLKQKKIELKSLHESIDTNSPTGTLIFHMFGALAEFERNLTKERTKAGLASARARGRMGGRPKSLDNSKRKAAIQLYRDDQYTAQQVCDIMHISRSTLYNYIRKDQSL